MSLWALEQVAAPHPGPLPALSEGVGGLGMRGEREGAGERGAASSANGARRASAVPQAASNRTAAVLRTLP